MSIEHCVHGDFVLDDLTIEHAENMDILKPFMCQKFSKQDCFDIDFIIMQEKDEEDDEDDEWDYDFSHIIFEIIKHLKNHLELYSLAGDSEDQSTVEYGEAEHMKRSIDLNIKGNKFCINVRRYRGDVDLQYNMDLEYDFWMNCLAYNNGNKLQPRPGSRIYNELKEVSNITMDILLCQARFRDGCELYGLLNWIKNQEINKKPDEICQNHLNFTKLCRNVGRMRKLGYKIVREETYPKPVSCKATCCDNVETYSIPELQETELAVGYCANCHTITSCDLKTQKYSTDLWDVEIMTIDE